MKELISSITTQLKWAYGCFWLIPVLLAVCGEYSDGHTGCYASDEQVTYLSEAVTILLTAITVPLSLKLFAWALLHRIMPLPLQKAILAYRWWSLTRLLMLQAAVWTGLFTYYATWSSTGFLCALIALTASLFCIPGERRMRNELHIEEKEEETDETLIL